MGRIYQKPPLVEALCEFRFEPSQPWDWTVPGLIYAEVKGEFPKKREQRTFEVALEEGPNETTHQLRREIGRMQFVRQDETALIQVGPDILAVNHLRPYPPWPSFRDLIARTLAHYRDVAHPKGVRRIGLRYINRIEVPNEETVEIDSYLVAIPRVPEILPQSYTRWVQRTEIPLESINAGLTLQSASLVDEEHGHQPVFMLDLDCWTLHPKQVALDHAMEWVERAHKAVEDAFEACVTDKTRQLFEEVRDESQRLRAEG